MNTFCLETGLWPRAETGGWDASTLVRFVAYLAPHVEVDTISTYMSNGPRVWHLLHGLPWDPLLASYAVQLTLRGARRVKGVGPKRQKLPITPEILAKIRMALDPSSVDDLTLWTACLVAFFGFLRKSNYAADTEAGAADAHILRRCDVARRPGSRRYWLSLCVTKTIQQWERTLHLVLPDIPGHLLDPTLALDLYLAQTALRPPGEFLFGRVDGARGWRPMTSRWFMGRVSQLLSTAGVPSPHLYGTHSFRRGGATFALRAGMSPVLIKVLGDWRSECFYDYCSVDEELREIAADVLSDQLWQGVPWRPPAPNPRAVGVPPPHNRDPRILAAVALN